MPVSRHAADGNIYTETGAFLAAAVWGGQWGGRIFILGAKNFG